MILLRANVIYKCLLNRLTESNVITLSCSQKSIVVNKNQQGARYIKLLKNVKLLKKYCCVSADFGEVKWTTKKPD